MNAEAPLPRAAHPVLGVLRAGVLWAALVLVVWVLLLRRFHGAVQVLAVAVREEVGGR